MHPNTLSKHAKFMETEVSIKKPNCCKHHNFSEGLRAMPRYFHFTKNVIMRISLTKMLKFCKNTSVVLARTFSFSYSHSQFCQ